MKEQIGQRFLVIYSGVLTAVFAVSVLSGFVSAPKKTSLEELDVQRIDLVEPDGTLRMVISDKARFPGAIIKGKEYAHERLDAGMLFYNDEGTENGGLIFSGYKDKDGKIVNSGGSLTFDKYEQDQLVQLLGAHDSDGHTAGLIVSDRPDRPIQQDLVEMQKIDAMPATEREQLMQARSKSNYYGSTRIVLARGDDGVAKISLRDADGHPRIVMGVAKDGTSSLKFLDASGKVLNELTPTSKP
ncbi:hypothetical protein [Rhodanobacter sp. MP1X3]|uniref:hypothetical protein n=1 Tax=Rhodanobacter sp. MP1X3 TaxID=2723086 RepID=UPI00162149AD|nr:hypothetical protein [Rhodanobacter sp. MP1X3]MBB6244218.1 hypothetical protein [Rhodanobacter sp. MP1X3]